MKNYWVPLSIFGAIIYGSFSLLLELVDPAIKNDTNAQFGYGLFLGFIQIPIILIIYGIWYYMFPDSRKLLMKNINWKIIALTIIVGILIGPVHTLVINAGGSVGQQTMYSLAILPVIFGGRYLLKEDLSIQQWVGIGFAALGAYLMSSGKHKSSK